MFWYVSFPRNLYQAVANPSFMKRQLSKSLLRSAIDTVFLVVMFKMQPILTVFGVSNLLQSMNEEMNG